MQHTLTNGRTPQEHYDLLDQVLTDLLRAAGATATDQLMAHLIVYERTLRSALGLPIEING